MTNIEDVEIFFSVFKKYIWCEGCSKPPGEADPDHVHEYLFLPDDLLNALCELRCLLRKETRKPVLINGTEPTLVRLMDSREVASVWKQFEDYFPGHREALWAALENGLKQYLTVLQERENIFEECDRLRKLNRELSRLLKRDFE